MTNFSFIKIDLKGNGGANYDQLTAAAAALNGVPPSFLSYFSPLAAAAAAATSSSPSPSPTSLPPGVNIPGLSGPAPNSLSQVGHHPGLGGMLPPGLMGGPSPSPSALAALTALMDPTLSKSAQAQLVAAAAAQQQSSYMMSNEMKDEHD